MPSLLTRAPASLTPRFRRTAWKCVVLWLATLAVLLPWAGQARAQSITLRQQGPTRTGPMRGDNEFPLWINYQDCIDENNLVFQFRATNFNQGGNFEVWANTSDCSNQMNRTGNNPQCWRVFRGTINTAAASVEIPARAIVAQRRPTDPNANEPLDELPASVCNNTAAGNAGLGLVLTFMFVANNQVQGTSATWSSTQNALQVGFDVVGPQPPAGVKAKPNEDSLDLSWNPQSSQVADLVGFRFYCDPPPGAATSATSTGTQALLLDSGISPFLSDAGFAGGSSVSTDAAAGGAGGPTAAGDAGTTGAANPDCPSTAIRSGLRPDEDYFCGSVTSKSSTVGRAKGLVNGKSYAVAVAARDLRGNVGKLSDVSCGSPVSVTDFFELYREDGGQAGGGFCSIGARSAPGVGLWFGATALGALARYRRRRRRRR